MQNEVPYAPEGHQDLSPYLIVRGAAKAIDFYKEAFDAIELSRMDRGEGKVMHAEIKVGNSVVMLADEVAEMGIHSPEAIGGSPVMLHVYVPDVDRRVAKAVAAGAQVIRPVQDEFYGNRSGGIKDPFGLIWYFATQKELLTGKQIAERAAAQKKN